MLEKTNEKRYWLHR